MQGGGGGDIWEDSLDQPFQLTESGYFMGQGNVK